METVKNVSFFGQGKFKKLTHL